MTGGRIRAGVAGFAILLFVLLVLASGLDRYSQHEPGAIRLIPDTFRVSAARSLAASALTRGDFPEAERQARAATKRDPLDPRGPAFLGAVAALDSSAGGDGGDAAFRAAAKLGWREMITQAYWFDRDLREDRIAAAALRLDAILRANPRSEAAQTFLGMLEAREDGRRALAERLRSGPAWAEAYLSGYAGDVEMLRARARFLASRSAGVPELGCERVLPMVRALSSRAYRGEAEALWQVHCPAGATAGALSDPGFDKFASDESGPFGWQRHGAGDVRVSPVGGKERMIELANRSSVTRLVLSQPVALTQGAHTVTGSVTGLKPALLVATLGCGHPERPSNVSGAIAASGQRIDAKGCANEVLGLWMRPGEGALTVDDLRIDGN
ncbi:hypothetical protein [Qipengyuania marisflavi]|uniref:Tetratricopeptide repeat protein n=1 Tax=Qipengyuania marisflavi TaxID=2486356 RepID=A0A5S3Q241_9SPHN|nr:hypothetical protein [Qipengyuania marisflavi]TMM50427.1 hypothetical protein FEV51_04470 [Qipengyuania marisflavi]